MKQTLVEIKLELKKRLAYPYKWGQKQNDNFDKQTNFIYHTFSFKELLSEIDKRFKSNSNYSSFFNYTINRWFNFWSAQAVENIRLLKCFRISRSVEIATIYMPREVSGLNRTT